MARGWTSSTGNLNKRIDFIAPVRTVARSGQPIETMQTVFTTWAEVNDLRGKERLAMGQESSEAVAVFLIRWRNDHAIKKDMQIAYEGKVYEITSVAEIGNRDRFEIWTRIRRDD